MKQRLIAYLLLLPIVLLGLSVLLWARSYLPEGLYCRVLEGQLLLFSASGRYAAYLERAGSDLRSVAGIVQEVRGNRWNAVNWRQVGFELVVSPRGVTPTYTMVGIPFVAIVLVLAPLAVWSWYAHRRYCRRLQPGHCARCGYDLRASTERCPECGTAIPTRGEGRSSDAVA